MTPCDPDSNILRAFIVNKSIDRVERLEAKKTGGIDLNTTGFPFSFSRSYVAFQRVVYRLLSIVG